jgi:hypothetical protein
MEDNVLKDPDFLFTLLAAIMKRSGEGKLVISDEDILAVDAAEAAEELAARSNALDELHTRVDNSRSNPPRLKLVPELEDNDESTEDV